MGRRGHRRRPGFELFESRALLSVGSGTAPGIAAEMSRRTTEAAELLAGTIRGPYRSLEATFTPYVGPIYLFNGTGHVGGLGHATATGDMLGAGFIRQGRAGGEYTLRRGGDSVEIQLTALQEQPGSSALPADYSYAITGGTGHYKDASGSGSATLTMVPAQGHGGGLPGNPGSFALVLRPAGTPD
jgi:hypothetical protein